MKINDLNPAAVNGLSTGSISSSGVGAYARGGRGAYGPAPDQVQLSSASRLASSALAAHTARLTQLKSLVASGEYNPSHEAVGQAMIGQAMMTEALSRSS